MGDYFECDCAGEGGGEMSEDHAGYDRLAPQYGREPGAAQRQIVEYAAIYIVRVEEIQEMLDRYAQAGWILHSVLPNLWVFERAINGKQRND